MQTFVDLDSKSVLPLAKKAAKNFGTYHEDGMNKLLNETAKKYNEQQWKWWKWLVGEWNPSDVARYFHTSFAPNDYWKHHGWPHRHEWKLFTKLISTCNEADTVVHIDINDYDLLITWANK